MMWSPGLRPEKRNSVEVSAPTGARARAGHQERSASGRELAVDSVRRAAVQLLGRDHHLVVKRRRQRAERREGSEGFEKKVGRSQPGECSGGAGSGLRLEHVGPGDIFRASNSTDRSGRA
jgi:hypothetical protein